MSENVWLAVLIGVVIVGMSADLVVFALTHRPAVWPLIPSMLALATLVGMAVWHTFADSWWYVGAVALFGYLFLRVVHIFRLGMARRWPS